MKRFKLKVVLAGDMGVGKTMFAAVNDQNQVIPTEKSADLESGLEQSTIGVDVRTASRQHDDVLRDSTMISCDATIQIWDTAGQEKFRSIVSSYFRQADALILVYDTTNEASFRNVKDYWYALARPMTPDHCRFFVLGTNSARPDARRVLATHATLYASTIDAIAFETDSLQRGGLLSYKVLTEISHMLCETAQEAVVPDGKPPKIIVITTAAKKRRCSAAI